MHLLITDSGVGGLSVCAGVERFLRRHGIGEDVRLTYVNASPENDFGYNSVASRQTRLEHFDRFLEIVTAKYAPNAVCVACNSLSVLLPDVPFCAAGRVPVQGIVETGVRRLLRGLQRTPESIALIFGTPTTIDEQTYPRRLSGEGIPAGRVVSQACPSLADTISEDREGAKAGAKIEHFVREAVGRSTNPGGPFLAYLACTHYGYRREFFDAAFARAGAPAEVLNPNDFVAEELFGSAAAEGPTAVEVEVVSRYRIPQAALETIAYFLQDRSPKTVSAFLDYTQIPDLYPAFELPDRCGR